MRPAARLTPKQVRRPGTLILRKVGLHTVCSLCSQLSHDGFQVIVLVDILPNHTPPRGHSPLIDLQTQRLHTNMRPTRTHLHPHLYQELCPTIRRTLSLRHPQDTNPPTSRAGPHTRCSAKE